MSKTVVGLMDNRARAEAAIRGLMHECRCEHEDIGLVVRDARPGGYDDIASGALKGGGTGAMVGGIAGLVAGAAALSIPGLGPMIAAGPIASALVGAGVGAAAGGIIGALTHAGVPEDDAHFYAEGVRRGGALVTVRAPSDDVAACAAGVLNRYVSADMEERAGAWKNEGWSGRFDEHAEVLPLAEEEISIGKRQVDHGSARVHATVVEEPVEETIALREERARIERRPVDRPAVPDDEVFKEMTIEIRETAEEAVVEKRSRVVEEIVVGKEVSEHEKTIRDTVRHTEVDIVRQHGAERRRADEPFDGPDRRAA
jgi:uncharacterized protein (TIGR02271 family)